MPYVDAFVLPVQIAREAAYIKMAEEGRDMWMGYGALSYVECRADDVPAGEVTSFPLAVKLEADEVVYISFITYRDRAHRDEVNAKVMADPASQDMPTEGPVNMRRMIFGGFVPVVSAG